MNNNNHKKRREEKKTEATTKITKKQYKNRGGSYVTQYWGNVSVKLADCSTVKKWKTAENIQLYLLLRCFCRYHRLRDAFPSLCYSFYERNQMISYINIYIYESLDNPMCVCVYVFFIWIAIYSNKLKYANCKRLFYGQLSLIVLMVSERYQ